MKGRGLVLSGMIEASDRKVFWSGGFGSKGATRLSFPVASLSKRGTGCENNQNWVKNYRFYQKNGL